jgi:2-methylcitrate dehydratase
MTVTEGRADTLTDGRLVTQELAEWVAGLRYEDLPDEVVAEAGSALADFLGESLFVGATKPWGQSIADFAATYGGGQPEATIIATGRKTLASRAALANGTMALGFEYADFGAGSRPYPFAVTGALALAEAEKRSGRDLALAIVVGYEVMGRITRATLPPSPPPFYVPALYGTLGASAACAKVLGLPAGQTTAALSLGAAFTGGTFQGHEEGSWQRSLNGGMASERAVSAAQLARTGFKASAMGLEGVQGFSAMYCNGRLDPEVLFGGLGDSFVITDRWVKAYPMNVTLHAPVEALLSIIREHDLRHTDIAEIDSAWQKVEPFLAKHKVSTVVSAQASLPFALAVAAVHREVSVDQFTDETVADQEVQAMITKTTVHQDAELFGKVKNSMPGRVTVRTNDGREFTAEVLYPKGNPANRLSEGEFKAKFSNMAARVLGTQQSDELYQRARALAEESDVAELAALFSPRGK